MSTWMSETGSYTTSPPGGTPLTPTPDNPGGYATFNETRDDLATVTNSATVVWMATATNSGTSESANMTYNGNAASNYTSHKVTAADAGTPAGSESGSYTATGGKGERSHIHREGGWGGSNYGGSYVFDDMLINGKGLIDTGFYPQGGGRQETSTVTTGGSETNTWWIHSPGTNWSRSHTSTTPFTTSNYENSAPDNLAKQPADPGPAPPEEAENGSKPGWAQTAWNWFTGALYDSTIGIPGRISAAIDVATKDQRPELDGYSSQYDKLVSDFIDPRSNMTPNQLKGGAISIAKGQAANMAKDAFTLADGVMAVGDGVGLVKVGGVLTKARISAGQQVANRGVFAKAAKFTEEELVSARPNAWRPKVPFTYNPNLKNLAEYTPGWPGTIEIRTGFPPLVELAGLRHEFAHMVLTVGTLHGTKYTYVVSNFARVAEEFAVHLYATQNWSKAIICAGKHVNGKHMFAETVVYVGAGSALYAWLSD